MVPRGVEGEQQVAHLPDALGVEAVGGLVEHQQPRLLQQRRRQSEPLPHAEGVAADPPVGGPAQPDLVERLADPGAAPAPGTRAGAAHRVEERQVGPPAQVRVGRRSLDQAAHLGSTRRAARGIGWSSTSMSPGGGEHQPEQHPHGRGLARAVGARGTRRRRPRGRRGPGRRRRRGRRTAWSGRGCGSRALRSSGRATGATPARRPTQVDERPSHGGARVTVPASSHGSSSGSVTSRCSGPVGHGAAPRRRHTEPGRVASSSRRSSASSSRSGSASSTVGPRP